MIVGFRGFPWGSRVSVTSDPHGGPFAGAVGTIQPAAIGASVAAVAMFCPDSDSCPCVEVLAGENWEFAPVVLQRRAREVYDHGAFAEDLELAINHLRSVVLGEHLREFSSPTLRSGVSTERAMYLVCLSLIERKLGEDFPRYLDQVLNDARVLLISKNRSYGNSALDPVRVFSTASLKEQLLVRLDDKVSRLARGHAAGEDVAADMLGYLLLVEIAEARERQRDTQKESS